MLCYKDRSYCGNEKCPKYSTCKESFLQAVREKAQSDDEFIRDEIGIAVYFPKQCPLVTESNFGRRDTKNE